MVIGLKLVLIGFVLILFGFTVVLIRSTMTLFGFTDYLNGSTHYSPLKKLHSLLVITVSGALSIYYLTPSAILA